jgi:hypothetical protein
LRFGACSRVRQDPHEFLTHAMASHRESGSQITPHGGRLAACQKPSGKLAGHRQREGGGVGPGMASGKTASSHTETRDTRTSAMTGSQAHVSCAGGGAGASTDLRE